METNKIKSWIKAHENTKYEAYDDSKLIRTIGIGFNLERSGAKETIEKLGLDYHKVLHGEVKLTENQVNQLFETSFNIAVNDAQKLFSNFNTLPEDKQLVLVDMSFNLGHPKLSEFTKLREAIKNEDFNKAAEEIKDSKYFNDVKTRGVDNYKVMQKGFESDKIENQGIMDLNQYPASFDSSKIQKMDSEVKVGTTLNNYPVDIALSKGNENLKVEHSISSNISDSSPSSKCGASDSSKVSNSSSISNGISDSTSSSNGI